MANGEWRIEERRGRLLFAIRYSPFATRHLSPHLARKRDDHRELRPLLLFRENVAFFGGGKSALRRETELLGRDKFGSLVDAALEIVLLLQRAELGRDEAEHDLLVALRHEAQRLETAGTV